MPPGAGPGGRTDSRLEGSVNATNLHESGRRKMASGRFYEQKGESHVGRGGEWLSGKGGIDLGCCGVRIGLD